MDDKKTPTQNIDGNSGELISFIDKERLNKKVNYKKIFRYFSKCLRKSIVEMNIKFKDLSNINESIISGINMIYHIYFILINYTNNIKLTIFLLERAILLYTEFIIMSQDKKMVDEIYFIPNINDAVSFSFKKTIGPILLNDMDNISKNASVNFNVKFLKEISIVVRNIYKLYFRKKCLTEDSRFISLQVEENMETLDKLFQDKNIISERELDEFKKYTQLCAEQNFKDEMKSNEEFDYLLDIENKFGDETSEYIKSSFDLNFNDFLNVVNNEVVESLLILGNNKKYPDILKKINCILNNDDTLGDKLGKIKIILFIFNNEYLDISYNSVLFKNDTFMFLRGISTKASNVKKNENIILNELRERLFDTLVYYNFKSSFNHNCDEEPTSLSIDIKNIEKQIDEIFTFIK